MRSKMRKILCMTSTVRARQELMRALSVRVRNWCLAPTKMKVRYFSPKVINPERLYGVKVTKILRAIENLKLGNLYISYKHGGHRKEDTENELSRLHKTDHSDQGVLFHLGWGGVSKRFVVLRASMEQLHRQSQKRTLCGQCRKSPSFKFTQIRAGLGYKVGEFNASLTW
jgi:hypothetical protein